LTRQKTQIAVDFPVPHSSLGRKSIKMEDSMKIFRLLIPMLLVASAVSTAPMPQKDRLDSKAAFEQLKTLIGEWQADTERGKARVQYELIAGGHTLVERESVGDMPPMLTLYHLDGDRLLLTHHCMLGNQPRMQARSFSAASAELNFEFLDITNLAGEDAGHMRDARFRFVDRNRFVSEWDFYENGRKKTTETFTL
jgi:hypothetical protein